MPSRGPHLDQVGFELGDHGEDVEQHRPTGSVGSCTDPPGLSFDMAVGEFLDAIGVRSSV